jgi:hypothetical protein
MKQMKKKRKVKVFDDLQQSLPEASGIGPRAGKTRTFTSDGATAST